MSINNLTESGVVLVDFYAEWCGPCKMLAPILDTLATELNDVSIIKINVDNDLKVAEQYGVMSVPTLIILKDGEMVASKQGFQSKEMLIKWIEQYK